MVPVGIVHGTYESAVPERATVYEQVPSPAREPGGIGTLDEPADPEAVDFGIQFEKLPGLLRAPDVGYATRGMVGWRKGHQLSTIRLEVERGSQIGERQEEDRLADGPGLGPGRPEKLGSGRDVLEERTHRDRRPRPAGDLVARHDSPPGDANPCRRTTIHGRRLHLEPAHGGNGRKGLAPETEGSDTLKVLRRADLARRVPVQGQERIGSAHPFAVVGDADERLPAISKCDTNRLRASVERVLDQFLHDRGGPLDDLSCRDLVRHPVGQDPDAPAGSRRVAHPATSTP